jgi:hypothetical protein
MDCSTWFLVGKQPKKTYPLPPRFLLSKVMWVRIDAGIWAESSVLFARFACWFCAGFGC